MSKHVKITPAADDDAITLYAPLSADEMDFYRTYGFPDGEEGRLVRRAFAETEAALAASPPAPSLPAPADRLAFDPVAVRPRKTGWTAHRQRVFIATLAETCSVTEACRAAGVTPRSAYRLRRRPGAESFDRAWDQALQCGIRQLTDIAFERAIVGRPRAIFHKGRHIADSFEPSDRALVYLLQHYDRMRFGDLSGFLPCDVPDPVGEARRALPGLLDDLIDHAATADPEGVEGFEILPDEE